jgi:hypothetical protein
VRPAGVEPLDDEQLDDGQVRLAAPRHLRADGRRRCLGVHPDQLAHDVAPDERGSDLRGTLDPF